MKAKISTKLHAIVGALLLVGFLLAGLGYHYLSNLGGELETANNKTAIRIQDVNRLRARGWEMVADMRGVFVFTSLSDKQRTGKAVAQFGEARRSYDELVASIRPLLDSDEGR